MCKSKLLNALIVLVVLFVFSFIIGWGYDSVRGAPVPVASPMVKVGANSIGGKVHVSKGGSPAGVWVIADTTQVLTNLGRPGHFRKIVVTDSKGNFLIPDLPNANAASYNVWVRGYGLADSTPVQAFPGQQVQLHADPASSPQEAAKIYPSSFWYSLFAPPPTSDFPGTGTGPGGNGIPASFQSQAAWVDDIKLGCELCHQVGNAETRDLLAPSDWDQAWNLAATMSGTADGLGRQVAAQKFADWADRIDAGEVPQQPKRPSGIAQNVVLTQWEWGDQFTYAHDEVATDKRNPELYPFGKVYGVDLGNDFLVMTDPVANVSSRVHVPTANGFSTKWCDQTFTPGIPSDLSKTRPNGFCTWNVYVNPANPHNPMMDSTGKVWMTTQIRREWDADLPDFCVNNPNGFDTSVIVGVPHHRQLGYFDTATNQFVLLDTCFGSHHLNFDNNGVLWVSGDVFVDGWLDPSKLDLTKPDFNLPNAEGWSKVQVDNGTGTIVPILGFHYGINVNPIDGSIWSSLPGYPGLIERYDGTTTAPGGKHEVYSPPFPYHGVRGVDMDTNGIVWVSLYGTGALASFDRSKCVANNHTAGTGNQCPEGWTIYQYKDTPQMVGVTDPGTADFHYLIWVDQQNASGMGANTVFVTGTGSDSLIVFNQTTKKFTIVRMPYPLGFFHRGLDGRIDDPNADWKGRGVWVDYGIDPLKHTETQMGQICHVQFRPSPLSQ